MARTRARRVSFDDLATRRGALTADDLIGLELTLEYTDADGVRTRRKVRIIRYYDDRKPTLYCYCHKRRDERSFLAERIGAVIDSDGVVLMPSEFFRLFGVWVPVIQAVNKDHAANATAAKGFGALATAETAVEAKPKPAVIKPTEANPVTAKLVETKPGQHRDGRISGRSVAAAIVTIFGIALLVSGRPAALFGFLSLVAAVLVPIAAIWPAIILPRSRSRLKAVLWAMVLLCAIIMVGIAVT